MSFDPQTPQPPIAVLVHGTFRPDAEWTKDGSAFRQYVAEALPGLIFDTFTWTGANAHEDRIGGGADLRERIRSLRTTYPDRAIFVIAHSHGGNVALYASHDPDSAREISGIVTLCTPFLSFRPRQVPRPLSWIFGSGLALLLVTPLVEVLGRAASGSAARLAHDLSPLWVLPVSIWLGQHSTLRSLYHQMRRWVAHTQNEAVALAPPTGVQCRVFNLQISFDEARMWLQAIGLAGQISVAIVPLIVLATLTVGTSALVWLALPVALAAAALSCMVIRGHRLGFGRSAVFTHLLVDIRAHDKPPAAPPRLQNEALAAEAPFAPHRWPYEYFLPKEQRHWLLLPPPAVQAVVHETKVTTLPISGWKIAYWFSSLRHSRLYNSRDIAETVAGWLALRLRETTPRG